MEINNWDHLSEKTKGHLLKEVKEVFFESSSVINFSSNEEKELFYQKWLGEYIDQFGEYFFVATEGNTFLGYIIGCPDSLGHPELKQPLVGLEEDYLSFPAHLHINCHHRSRGKGIGGILLKALENQCRARGLKGLHLITKKGEKNVGFYLKNGYGEIRSKTVNDVELLLLGKNLQ
ncbi:MAG: GNAT family N-acetyltransferase [Halobacteriovoraceae bacterium]|nr:GNAT family N-acetyltransferase [Halobacteriovoraceae bacterium]